jgi:hypothetical protein
MAGLLQNKGMQAQLQQIQQPKGKAPMVEEESTVSPEEQQMYDRFVENGAKIIYSQQVQDRLLEALSGGGDPVIGLVVTASSVVTQLEQSAQQNNMQLTEDVVFHGTVELLEMLIEMAETAGLHDFNEQEMERALFQTIENYRGSHGESIDQSSHQQDMEKLMQADQAGQLGQVAPELMQYGGGA